MRAPWRIVDSVGGESLVLTLFPASPSREASVALLPALLVLASQPRVAPVLADVARALTGLRDASLATSPALRPDQLTAIRFAVGSGALRLERPARPVITIADLPPLDPLPDPPPHTPWTPPPDELPPLDEYVPPLDEYIPPPASLPPPAPSPPSIPPEEPHWFEINVVDAWGQPLAGVELQLDHGEQRSLLVTTADGKAHLAGVDASDGEASLKDAEAVRNLLASQRPAGPAPDDLPGEFPQPERWDVNGVGVRMALPTRTPRTLVLTTALVRVRLVGLHFDTNKCFLKEAAMRGIRRVASVYEANPRGKLLIVGHTDTTGDESYNLDLSLERAQAVRAYLADDVDAWEAWFSPGKPPLKRWGQTEENAMIAALGCEPPTVKGFQQWSNQQRATALAVDGVAGPKTRRALIEAYMALDGTTLPAGIEAVVHGCGEYFPRSDEQDQQGADGVEAAENRRVELLCFPDQILPPCPGDRATAGEPEYEAWKAQVTHSYDVESGGEGEALVLEWPDHLTEVLPPDLELVVELGGTFRKRWSDGVVVEGFRRFTFPDVASDGTCNLFARTGKQLLALWVAQRVNDPSMPPMWTHLLEQLTTWTEPAIPAEKDGKFPEVS